MPIATFLLGGQFYGADEDYPPADSVALARSSALEALRLDEDLAEPLATLGFIRFAYDWDWDGAEKDFLASVDRDPDYGQARLWYSLFLTMMDRHDEAIAEARRAVTLEPTSALFNRALGTAYARANRYDEAIEQLEKTFELAPTFALTREQLMDLYWVTGAKDKAVSIAQDFDPDVGRVYRLAAEGRMDEARVALTSIPAPLSEGSGIVRYLLVGDNDRFFDALEAWVESSDRPVLAVIDNPLVHPLRSDPRMIAVRERMGLSP